MKLFITLFATSVVVITNVLCMGEFPVACPAEILTPEVIDRARHFTKVKPSQVEITGLYGVDNEFALELSALLKKSLTITSHGARDNLAVTFDWGTLSKSIIVPPDTGLYQSLVNSNNSTIARFAEFNQEFSVIKAQKNVLDETVAQQGVKLQEYAQISTKYEALNQEHTKALSNIAQLKASIVQKDDLGTSLINDHIQLTEQLSQLKKDLNNSTQDYQKVQTTIATQATQIKTIQELLAKANKDLAEGNKNLEEARNRRTFFNRATDPVTFAAALVSGLAVYYYMKNEN